MAVKVALAESGEAEAASWSMEVQPSVMVMHGSEKSYLVREDPHPAVADSDSYLVDRQRSVEVSHSRAFVGRPPQSMPLVSLSSDSFVALPHAAAPMMEVGAVIQYRPSNWCLE